MDDRVRLILGDCLTLMRDIPDGSVDAVVTDPPYGIGDHAPGDPRRTEFRTGKRVGSGNNWHPDTDWDDSINPEWCRECCRVAPVVAWFGHWRKRSEVEAAMTHPIRAEIVWAKDCHVGPPCPLAMKDERIWLFSESEIKWRRFEVSVWEEKIIPTWRFKHHKNEKPLRLMIRLVTFLTDPGQTILDPFAGSATTLVACVKTDRRGIGFEIDPFNVSIGERRLAAAATPLFDGIPTPPPLAAVEAEGGAGAA